MFCSVCITDSCKHICDWITHSHLKLPPIFSFFIYLLHPSDAAGKSDRFYYGYPVCSFYFVAYQEAFFTPGICPLYANSRKHTLQIPYFLKYACGRPQILQRLYSLVENFCLRCCLIFIDVFAMKYFLPTIL